MEFLMLNTKQQEIVDAVKNLDKRVFMLKGEAGTGKSFTLKTSLDEYTGSVLLTATTNKAKALLKESTGYTALTTHSALGFRMIRNGIEEYLNDVNPAMEADLLIIDEYSMLPQSVWIKALNSSYKKILLVGDDHQLPAIGLKAKIEAEFEITLSEQMRQQNMTELNEFFKTEIFICFAKFFNNNNVTLMDLVNYINDKYYHLPIYDIPFYVRKGKIEK